MENVTVIQADDAIARELAAARLGAAEAQRAAYGANVRYAKVLNVVFSGFDWFDLSGTDTSDEGKQVRKEKGMFFEALKAINPDHSNPSTIWARIRAVAKADRYPAPAKAEAEAGEVTEAEQGESGAKHNRSPLTRNIEDLSTLFKFNQRQDNLEDKVKRANVKIAEALRELGVDISLLNAK